MTAAKNMTQWENEALYVAFVVLALTNIATGMFVQASLGAHERQREKAMALKQGSYGYFGA